MIRLTFARLLVVTGLMALPLALRAQSGTASLEVDFTVPGGYLVQNKQGSVFIMPQSPGDVRTPCVYGLAPRRPSTGRLEADADAALRETVAGDLPRINDRRISLRGVAAAGWSYVLSGGEFQGQVAGENSFFAMMAMVFPAQANRVNVVFGLGPLGRCTFNDVPFAQLFHSLRPRGWSPPGVNPLGRELIGRWEGSALSGHTFYADGTYSRTASGSTYDKPIAADAAGLYALRGSEVTITTRPGQAPERVRVQVYDKWNNARWERTLAVLYDDARPPYVAEYTRARQ